MLNFKHQVFHQMRRKRWDFAFHWGGSRAQRIKHNIVD